MLKKTKGGRQFGKQNDLETTFLLIRKVIGRKMYPEQHSPLSWSRRPARPWQPYSLGFFPGLQLPYRQLSNVTPDRPLRPGSLTNSSWMRNCTVLGDAAWWPLRATLIFFPSNIPQPGFLSPSCRSILF